CPSIVCSLPGAKFLRLQGLKNDNCHDKRISFAKDLGMSKCDQCIVRQFSSLKALTKEEVLRMASCKTSRLVKKGEAIFQEGEHVNGVFCVENGVCKLTKLSANGKDQIVKLVKKGELLGQRSMISEEPANLSA